MKYFIDTEFIEDFTQPFLSKSRHYIDLISIGLVAEDGREYYAISNEFDIDHVWNKHEVKQNEFDFTGRQTYKEYWLRDNVLMPIFYEMAMKEWGTKEGLSLASFKADQVWSSDVWWFKWLLRKKYGKSNKLIAQEIEKFVFRKGEGDSLKGRNGYPISFQEWKETYGSPEFYGYYSAYDHVLLCSLFGRMIDLPKGFPMYTIDLKQILEEKNAVLKKGGVEHRSLFTNITVDFATQHNYVRYQNHIDYPKQTNEHNALADARWNRDLYNFLQSL